VTKCFVSFCLLGVSPRPSKSLTLEFSGSLVLSSTSKTSIMKVPYYLLNAIQWWKQSTLPHGDYGIDEFFWEFHPASTRDESQLLRKINVELYAKQIPPFVASLLASVKSVFVPTRFSVSTSLGECSSSSLFDRTGWSHIPRPLGKFLLNYL
jgi:hypothetical protein